MSRQIFLHAGAHRTGTSSFQLCLARNKPVLTASGYDVAYPGRDGIPGGDLRMRLPRPRHGADDIPVFVDRLKNALVSQVSDTRSSLILSEENLPGLIMSFFSGRLYPNRKKRLQVFREALGAIDGQITHLLFVVRPYDQLFQSGFRKHAEDNYLKPFGAYAETMANFSGGWPETVQALRNVLRPDRLTVVEYGQRGSSAALLHRLLDEDCSDFEEPQSNLNKSATDAALGKLQSIYATGQKLKRSEWQSIIDECAHQTENRQFAQFSVEQKNVLMARYDADLHRLAEMKGVSLHAGS